MVEMIDEVYLMNLDEREKGIALEMEEWKNFARDRTEEREELRCQIVGKNERTSLETGRERVRNFDAKPR